MTTYLDVSQTSTSHLDAGHGALLKCDNDVILCSTEEWLCDGSVNMRPSFLVQGELLANPTFNDNATDWTAVDCTIASSHPAGGGVSDDHLIITRTGGIFQYAYQRHLIPVGTLVRFSVYLKSGSSGNESASIIIQGGTPGFTAITAVNPTSSASWVKYTVSGVTITEDTYAIVLKRSATAGTMLFDEASLTIATSYSDISYT